MNLILQRILVVGCITLWVSGYTYAQGVLGSKKNPVKVRKTTSSMVIDGKSDDASWKMAEAYSFDHFINVEKPSDVQNTSFKILWDEDHIYLLYECKDKFITARMKDRDGWTFVDDCAEIFLIPSSEKVHMHFGFELNLYKTANDFVFLNDMHKDGNFVVKSYSPEYEVAVKIEGTINDNSDIDKGWSMEMAIPYGVFHMVGPATPLEEGAIWAFMALRQDRNEELGQRVTASTIFPLKGKAKDVHDPKNFGFLQFVKAGE